MGSAYMPVRRRGKKCRVSVRSGAARISLYAAPMNDKTNRSAKLSAPRPRRMIAVGKKQNGRWQVRTSLWRYLASTAISQ